ncbi:MAG: MOSC N-terminal beta barrel domain-containing protein [Roseovarius sp.]|nr:MOSC N-terminal beta barrel domain-containing protein [Roseovarius sp.]
MTGTVAALWRYPIKAHGRESVETMVLTRGQTIPWDRRWAVFHEMSDADGGKWVSCVNFSRGAKVPALMAIETACDGERGTVRLSHPDRPDIEFNPDQDQQMFLDWVRPLMPANRAQSVGIVRVEGRGMTDTDYPSASLLNIATSSAVARELGREISPLRWRANIHLEGFSAWEEFDWIGKTVCIGTARLAIRERIRRCLATASNPGTGIRDADTLGVLNSRFGHQDFGVYAEIAESGEIRAGDSVEVC